jgi:hypothetical protein
MRRIDVIGITLGVFLGGGILYAVLQLSGIDSLSAGVWSQALLVLGLVGWVATYLFRVVNRDMTYSQQVQDYKDAVLQKRFEEMTPEEIAQLQAEIEREASEKNS